MTLFAILICIGVQRYFNLSVKDFWHVWLRSYVQGITTVLTTIRLGNGYVKTICIVLPILILVIGLEYILHNVWFNLPNFVLNVIILFACLDVRKLDDGAVEYRQLFLRADDSVFSVLFWYIVAGPVGALIYTVINYLAQDQADGAADAKIKEVLDWVPVRLTGLSYALVGHFNYGFAYWRKHALSGLSATRDFSYAAGCAALELGEGDVAEKHLAIDLIDRALILWIAIIAVFTLVAWVS